jgi:hypothetical protein
MTDDACHFCVSDNGSVIIRDVNGGKCTITPLIARLPGGEAGAAVRIDVGGFGFTIPASLAVKMGDALILAADHADACLDEEVRS